ncbi:MAG: hypothetical protein JWP86_2169 [Phenylobacterium sp.]|nr:hypothetical protein [Phenylobacterium sp.]
MDASESQAAGEVEDTPGEALSWEDAVPDAARRAAVDLRSQIAALRQQVKEAQDTLRDHHRRQEARTFKG